MPGETSPKASPKAGTQLDSDNVSDGVPLGAIEPDEKGVLENEIEKADVVLKDPQLRGTVASELSHSVEAQVVVAALLLVVAVGCDCITALETPHGQADTVSSMRTSSLVTLLALASPTIVKDRIVDQRFVLLSLLIVLSLSGDHYGNINVRIGDATYTILVLLLSVQIYNAGGIESGSTRPDNILNSPHRRQTMSGLCGALFLYVGLRGLRSAFVAAQEAKDFSVRLSILDNNYVSAGYAFMSGSSIIPLGFGHGVLAAVGILICLHGDAHVTGSSAVAFEVGAAGIASSIAALWSSIGFSEQIDTLRVLYGPSGCRGSVDLCEEAYRARRFAISNGSASGLWMGSLAACVFSYAIERRTTTEFFTRAEVMWRRQGFGSGVILLAAACIGIFSYQSFDGSQWHTDINAIVAVFGIFVSFTGDTLLGTAIYVGAQGYEEIRLLVRFGEERVFCHLTHCILFFSIGLLGLHLSLCVLKTLLLCWFDVRPESPINLMLGYIATFGTSLAAILYIASAVLMASSNGSLPEDMEAIRDGSGARTMISFVINHFAPICAWIPLYSCRCEVQIMNSYHRAAAWIVSLLVVVIVYSFSLSYLGIDAPSVAIVDVGPFVLVGGAGALSWFAGAFV